MRFFVIAFAAVIAVVGAATLSADYLPPVVENSLPVQEYLAPAAEGTDSKTVLANDGYRYKTLRRLKFRHRRDVNELPAGEYLPPATHAEESLISAAPEPVAEVHTQLADDGYRYKVVRRLKYRQRRDVNELPKNEYLPPTEVSEDSTVVDVAQPVQEEQTQLANDGYRYKVVRRLKYRQRRDVNELPQNQYLAPAASNDTPQNEYLPPVEEAPASAIVKSAETDPVPETQLANDGYRYKVVRRLKYRHRRDVNELPQKEYLAPQNEYLPPAVQAQSTALPKSVGSVPEEGTQLSADGYRYKVVRRQKYRHRRDVNELPQNEYLAPAAANNAPQNEYLPPAVETPEAALTKSAEPAPEQATQLSADGYRYKVVRRLKYRHRRDVNELPQNEYLPPAEAVQEITVPSAVAEPATEDGATFLANDGYRYKAVRRLKYRHRRDVNELPANEYLPPTVAEVQEVAEQQPEVSAAVLTNDGYQYKTVRRSKYRRH